MRGRLITLAAGAALLLTGSTGGVAAASPAAARLNATLTGTPSPQRKADPPGRSSAVHTIVIDAGHGGRDHGCSGATSLEKTLALRIALALGALIEERRPGIEVVYTRDADVFVPLHERAALANAAHADLFVSIHCNYLVGAPQIQGTETYVMGLHTAERNLDVAKRENAAIRLESDESQDHYDFDPGSPAGHIILSMFQHAFQEQSLALAEDLERSLAQREGRRSRGVQQAGFAVLKETTMPSVLVETGYLSNAWEEEYLASAEGMSATAEALYTGLATYLRRRRSGGGEQAVLAAARLEEPQAGRSPAEVQVGGLEALSAAVAAPEAEAAIPGAGAATEPGAPDDASAPTYYVQLAAASVELDTVGPAWFKLGRPVRMVEEAGVYKYQAGPFLSRQEATSTRRLAERGGFKGAFVVGYRTGKKLTPQQLRALRS